MISKTPKFDNAIDEVLSKLQPHERKCASCGENFLVEKEDIDFYKMLRVPPPTLCPLCRKKRRFGQFMRVPKFFKKKCGVPGHTEEAITVFPPSSPHKIYDFSFYHSDGWDAATYGRERDPLGVGVEYTLGGRGGKNNYYCSMGFESQDCRYCFDVRFSNNVADSHLITNSEFLYQCVASAFCNHCISVVGCSHCIDCAFLYDCKNCSNCFLSSNLRNKSYVFENEQFTKEEYEKKIAGINLGKREQFNACLRNFNKLMEKALHRSIQTVNTNGSVGDSLMECNQCYFVFQTMKSDHVRFADNLLGTKDSMDAVNVLGEKFYETVVGVPGNARFSLYVRNSIDMEYCVECYDCHDCFGCVGLKNKKFHIFNKPYSENEYWPKIDDVKSSMLKNGEYGEFFPLEFGLFPYQSSNGQKNFPINGVRAKEIGIPWYDEPDTNVPENARIRRAPEDIPDDIRNVTDEILDDVILCEATKKPFLITRAELGFYRRMNVPIPMKNPWRRMEERSELERGVWLYPFICPKCGERSFSTYNPLQQERLSIYCEECYLKEVV